jgi:hypothetical protein
VATLLPRASEKYLIMLDELQLRLATYYNHSLNQPQASIGPLVVLTGGWASSLYTFTLQSQPDSADVATLVLKTYAPTTQGQAHAAREWQALTRLRAADYPAPRAILFD